MGLHRAMTRPTPSRISEAHRYGVVHGRNDAQEQHIDVSNWVEHRKSLLWLVHPVSRELMACRGSGYSE
jgi:hypothetical protein